MLVTLRIPKKNRTTAQSKRLLCQVIDQSTPGRYQLQSEYGVLRNTFSTGEPDSTSDTLSFTPKVVDPSKQVTLNFASRQERMNVGPGSEKV